MTRDSTIVISGTGIITSLGRGRREVFDAIVAGRVGLGPMPALEQRPDPDLGGGQAVDIAAEPGDEETDRAIVYLRAAVRDAIEESGITIGDGRRVAVVLGSTLHGMRSAGKYLRTNDTGELATFLAGPTLDRAVEGLGLGAIRMTTCAACSSGLSSVGLGMTLLRAGEADVVIAGGYDTVSEYAYAGFNALRLVTPESLRPFGQDRLGMKIAEGYGTLVLERAQDTTARGGTAFAVVAGYGESSDAFHLTQPNPDGEGAADAIAQAIEESGVATSGIGLVAAHATGTPANDAAEYQALGRAFGDGLASTPVVGFKGSLGHTLGGAGAVELILSLEAMRRGVVPSTPAADRKDTQFESLRLAETAKPNQTIGGTLNLSLGFGGSNTAVVLRPASDDRAHATRASVEDGSLDPVITGVGVVLPGAIGFEAFAERLSIGERFEGGEIATADYAGLLVTRRLRRVSEYAKLSLAAASDAVRHAGLQPNNAGSGEDGLGRCSAVLGTMHGSSAYCDQYYRQIVDEGINSANPVLFAEGVPNAAAAHLSMGLGLRGGCQTIIGTRTAGLEALILAGLRVREGRVSRCLVAAAEEFSLIANTAHADCGASSAKAGSSGAIALMVESRESASARGARVLATLGPFGWTRPGPEDAASIEDLGKADCVWRDFPRRERDTVEGANANGRSVADLFPEFYSVSSLVAVAACLARGEETAGVRSRDFAGRECGLVFRLGR